MANLDEALQQLRDEREQAQFRVEKLYQAISTIESLNGSGASRKTTRIVSAPGRQRMAKAQRARWARMRARNVVSIASKRRKHTISAAGRRRIAAAARARWAKFRAGKK
jgi:hypothetical protein